MPLAVSRHSNSVPLLHCVKIGWSDWDILESGRASHPDALDVKELTGRCTYHIPFVRRI